jgi:tRNA A-37 threonylcarbamoyl transferase component Bud32
MLPQDATPLTAPPGPPYDAGMPLEGEDLPELTVPDAPGSVTLSGLPGDRYQPVARLGAGAFGEVFRARDALLGRDVAVKRIRLDAFAEPAQLEEVKQRFVREAQVAARLHHPNIVTVHDIVATGATSIIVMELVEGETLQSRLRARGRLDLAETTRLLGQVASALDRAHASQVVHRDVKPANIMIEPSGQVKVMDFGIAKLETAANLTSTGLIMGTPNYMSPEQARGLKVDGRSDLFSLGCVLYECLTGTRPFQAESVSGILVKILTEEPLPVDFRAAGLPPGVGAVLSRAMAKEPSARYPSGAAMIEALRAQATGAAGPVTLTVPSAPPPSADPAAGARGTTVSAPAVPARDRRWLGVAAISLALLATLGWLGWGRRTGTPAGGPRSAVVEEDVGLLGRLLGRTARVRVTLPAETTFRLALETPLSSESAVTGDALSAETTSPVRIEGLEAVPAGSRLTGRVTHSSSAAQSAGRGEMTLEFDTLELPDGASTSVRARPLGLRAPAPKKPDSTLVTGLSEVGAAVGGLIGGRKGAAAGTVVGGTAGAVMVTTSQGREVTLAARAPLSVKLLEPVTVVRPKQP